MVRRRLLAGHLRAWRSSSRVAGIFGTGPQPRRGVHRRPGASSTPPPQPSRADEAREAVADAGLPEAVVQESAGEDNPVITVRTGEITNDEADEIQAGLAAIGGDAERITTTRSRPASATSCATRR